MATINQSDYYKPVYMALALVVVFLAGIIVGEEGEKERALASAKAPELIAKANTK